MDRRLQTKRYGQMFVDSLPPCTVVRGPVADLPRQAALWIDHGLAAGQDETPPDSVAENGLEYVSFDDL
jgi:hypothetical protein